MTKIEFYKEELRNVEAEIVHHQENFENSSYIPTLLKEKARLFDLILSLV